MFNQHAISSFSNPNRIGSNQNYNYGNNGKKGLSNPHVFNHNQLFKNIISLLLPLLQELLSQFQNNNDCCQPNNLKLSDGELEKLNQALYPDGLTSAAGLPSATGVIDNDCDGKISIGDQVKTTFTNPATQETINGTVLVDQKILDRFNAPPSPTVSLSFDDLDFNLLLEAANIDTNIFGFFGYGDSNSDGLLSVGDRVFYDNLSDINAPPGVIIDQGFTGTEITEEVFQRYTELVITNR